MTKPRNYKLCLERDTPQVRKKRRDHRVCADRTSAGVGEVLFY